MATINVTNVVREFRQADAQAYLDTINALPPRCREAFRMYLFDEITNKQIAERMGVSLGMVDQYIKRGKLACQARRKELESDN